MNKLIFLPEALNSGTSALPRRLVLPLAIPAFTVCASLCSPSAEAQGINEKPTVILEEIIVTATRRETSLQNTAITIQAITEDTLDDLGATDLDDIVGHVPGLVVTGGDYTIRGLRSNLGDRSGTIGTTSRYLDEIPIEHNFRLFDMARVEVLKGPQGSLYGAGAMGGTIRMVTNKPNSQEFYGNIDVDYSSTSESDDDNHEINAAVNVPLVTDKFALRAVAYQHDYAGFIDNVRLNINDGNREEVTGGRLAVRWDATSNLSITGTYMREDIETSGTGSEDLSLGSLRTDRFFENYGDQTWEIRNLLVDWDLEWASLVFSGTRTELERDSASESTRFINGAFGLPDPPNGGFLNAFQIQLGGAETDVAELRLVSTMDNQWEWVIGAFYQDIDTSNDNSLFVTEVDPNNPAIGIRVGDIDGFANRDQLIDQHIVIDTEREFSGFGELTYHFTEQLSMTGGIRYLDVVQNNQIYALSTLFGFPPGLGDPLPLISVSHSDYYTKFRVAYEFNDDLMVFFIRSEGFRRGGFNASAALGEAFGVPNIPAAFDSDEVVNWELGLHSAWLDNRLILNGALYYIDWKDIRVGANDPSGLNFTTNGPGADVYGLELELYYILTENFDIVATAALTSTELNSEDVDPVLDGLGVPYPDNLTLAPKGEDLPGIPEETFSLTLNYNVPNLFGTFDGYARLDSTYTSGTYNTYEQGQFSFGRVKMDSYAISNLRLGLANDDGWDVSVYVNNLSDERADLFISQGGINPQSTARNRPRTIGLNIRKRFR